MMKSEEFSSVPSVQAAVLFGSQARRDADSKSDIDVAVFAHSQTMDEMMETKRLLSANGTSLKSISVYSVRSAEYMAADGSLFLWHLKLEGNLLYSRGPWLSRMLDRLNVYSRNKATLDLNTLRTVLLDIEAALRTEETLEFEAATLYSVLRTTGMIASMLHGSPCFGRLQPIYVMNSVLPLGARINDSELEELLDARLAYSRGATLRPRHQTVLPLCLTLCRTGQRIVEHFLESMP